MIDYYSRVAPVLLPHLAGRPVTLVDRRDGRPVEVDVPDWVRTDGPGGRPLIEDLPTLVWAADLGAPEPHVPPRTAGRRVPDRLVFDLVPAAGATLADCCRVAERLHDLLTADGLAPLARTGGTGGLQVHAGIRARGARRPMAYARQRARLLTGPVLVDAAGTAPAATCVAPYVLRGTDRPVASVPVTWDEVRACRDPARLTFTPEDVLDRIAEHGDLFAALDRTRAALPPP